MKFSVQSLSGLILSEKFIQENYIEHQL